MELILKRTCVVLILAVALQSAESVYFTKQPTNMTVRKGQTAWFFWDYKLEAAETLSNLELALIRRTDGIKIQIGSGKVLKAATGLTKFAKAKNGSIGIQNVNYDRAGLYFLSVYLTNAKSIHSHKTSLTVEGKASLKRVPDDRTESFYENKNATFKIETIGVPIPMVVYKWEDSKPKEVQGVVQRKFYQSEAKVSLGPLTRERCGRYITAHAKNKLGQSDETKIKIEVYFTPKMAQNVKADYVDDKTRVEVKWDKQESGLCKLEYVVMYMNAAGKIVHNTTGIDTLSSYAKNPKSNVIKKIAIRVTGSMKGVTAYHKVGKDPPEGAERKKGNNTLSIVLGSIGGILLLIAIAVMVYFGARHRKRKVGHA